MFYLVKDPLTTGNIDVSWSQESHVDYFEFSGPSNPVQALPDGKAGLKRELKG